MGLGLRHKLLDGIRHGLLGHCHLAHDLIVFLPVLLCRLRLLCQVCKVVSEEGMDLGPTRGEFAEEGLSLRRAALGVKAGGVNSGLGVVGYDGYDGEKDEDHEPGAEPVPRRRLAED